MEVMAQQLKTGYNPLVVEHAWGYQLLIQLFVDEDGVATCSVARRKDTWDTWSPPIEARHG